MHEKTLSITPAFTGRLFSVEVHQVELEPGRRAHREIVRHSNAIGAVARLPDGRFVFVRQFRKPIERDVLEIVAGGMDPDESPEDCAAREIREETGHEVVALHPLGAIHPSPGYVDELIHLFFAEVSDSPAPQDGDPDERITVEYLTREEFEAMVDGGLIDDSKTLSAWLLFTRRFDRQASTRT